MKRKIAVECAEGKKNQIKDYFDMQKDIYNKITMEPVRDYIYDLDKYIYNSKGERVPFIDKTPE